jgi:hypothetical protein
LLAAINTVLDYGDYRRLKRVPDDNDLPVIGESLANGTYNPTVWFERGEAKQNAISGGEPALDPTFEYRLLALNALKEATSRVSTRFGGILFEDPFYALLACFNAGTYHRLLLLPRVNTGDQAWRQRDAIVSSLTNGTYDPGRLFFECLTRGENRTGLPMRLLDVRGDLLANLRQTGNGNVRDSAGFSGYALYEFV